MKKIFTLMLTVSLATGAFAQYDNRQGNERNNDVAFNDRHDKWQNDRHDRNDNDRYRDGDRDMDRDSYFKKMEMQRQIADINRDYERQICSVKDNCFMTSFRKQRMINELQDRRSCEIKEVCENFYGKRQERNW